MQGVGDRFPQAQNRAKDSSSQVCNLICFSNFVSQSVTDVMGSGVLEMCFC